MYVSRAETVSNGNCKGYNTLLFDITCISRATVLNATNRAWSLVEESSVLLDRAQLQPLTWNTQRIPALSSSLIGYINLVL